MSVDESVFLVAKKLNMMLNRASRERSRQDGFCSRDRKDTERRRRFAEGRQLDAAACRGKQSL